MDDLKAQIEALQLQIAALSVIVKGIQDSTTMPNNVEGAMRNRLFTFSTQDPDTFVQTLTSTPGGVITPVAFTGYIEVLNGVYIPYYKTP